MQLPPPGKIPDSTRLQSDEEVEAFFEVTSSKPVRLQIVLFKPEDHTALGFCKLAALVCSSPFRVTNTDTSSWTKYL